MTLAPGGPGAPSAVDGARPVTRVLVVDDDPDINRLLRARLSTRGYETDGAANGEEALERIAESPPDVVFLDVSMPGIGGLEVLDRVRAEGHDLAVVMTTAFGSETVAIEALRRGADDYLRKPFERQEFQAVLDRTVSRLELSRQNVALRRQLDEKRRQLEAELERASRVQADLLPRVPPDLAGYELAARCIPAREVGGDFYDWEQPSPGVLSFTLGDVMGKGMPAALLMATVRAALRAVAAENAPARAVALAAGALEADLDRSGAFLTLFHARLDAATGLVAFVDAGHGHAFLLRADGRTETLEPRGLPVGVPLAGSAEEGLAALAAGDALVLYSDGLIDARPDESADPTRLSALLEGAVSADEMVQRLADWVSGVPALPDDLTLIVLRRRA